MVVSSDIDEAAGKRAGDEQTLVYEVSQGEAGERLDVALSRLGAASRSQVQRWIDAGRVLVDGETARRASKVSLGMILEATPPPPPASEVVAEALPLAVLHEDDDLLVDSVDEIDRCAVIFTDWAGELD